MKVLAIGVAALAVACGGNDASDPGPRIVDVTMSSARLLPGESVTITAVVQPEAEDKPIASGQLVRGSLNLGTFVETSTNTYQATATWEALAQGDVRGLVGQTASAPVTVRFFDEDGESTDAEVVVSLGCESSSDAVCRGGCLDATWDSQHCGGCEQACSGTIEGTDQNVGCKFAKCGTGSHSVNDRRACADVCAGFRYGGRAMTCEPICLLEGGGGAFSFDFNEGDRAGLGWYDNDPFTDLYLQEFSSCDDVPPTSVDTGVGPLDYGFHFCCCVATFEAPAEPPRY